MKIIVASSNQGKIKEYEALLAPYGYEVVSLVQLGYKKKIAETADSFFGNALIKAETIYQEFHLPVIADDSGLCVRALNGEPGIYSSRYQGKHSDIERQDALLEAMQNQIDRYAYFHCSIVFYYQDHSYCHFSGELVGEIAKYKKGTNGFGYDPIFLLANGETLAEVDEDTKNQISHRGKAAIALVAYLSNDFNN